MSKKRQHFVPQAYLKSWDISSGTKSHQVYVYLDKSTNGQLSNIDKVLWKPNLYTVNYDYSFIFPYCHLIKMDFCEKIAQLMKERKPDPVYAKYKNHAINNSKTVFKHLQHLNDWEFYYKRTNDLARKNSIIQDIHALNSYILEDGFDKFFETRWDDILHKFLSEANAPIDCVNECIVITPSTMDSILEFLLMMYMRNPVFDGLGIYTWIYNDVLKPSIGEGSYELIEGSWLLELYRLLYNPDKNRFKILLNKIKSDFQFIIYKPYPNEGSFITSDNPVCIYKPSVIEIEQKKSLIFPLTPDYLLYMGKGQDNYNFLDYRLLHTNEIKRINNMIYSQKTEKIISTENSLNKIL